jgi:hypothetical protein
VIDIAKRASEHRMVAFVAHDTIDVIMDRVERLVRSERRMTLVRRYLGEQSHMKISTGLVVDTDARNGGLYRGRQNNPSGKWLSLVLRPGIEMFSVSAHDKDGDEAEVQRRYNSTRKDCDIITITGGADGYGFGRQDQIELTRYNEFGVGEDVTIAFDTVEGSEVADAQAQVLDTLAGTGQDWTPDALTEQARRLRWHWRTLAEDLGKTDN